MDDIRRELIEELHVIAAVDIDGARRQHNAVQCRRLAAEVETVDDDLLGRLAAIEMGGSWGVELFTEMIEENAIDTTASASAMISRFLRVMEFQEPARGFQEPARGFYDPSWD